MTTNKYGLTRDIPLPIKRQVRNACGYGCVICGNAIYQYEHIDPPFSEAKEHNPDQIALLCGSCHDQVTRAIWSKQKVIDSRLNPICRQQGFSQVGLDITSREQFVIKIGNTEFVNMGPVIQIDGKDILVINPPEALNAPPVITAHFYDRNNLGIADIIENEWRGSTEAFDIETKGNTISIRSDSGQIDLVIELHPPKMISIVRMNMRYGDTQISGTSEDGFIANTSSSKISIPSDSIRIEKAPYWLSCSNDIVSLGSDTVLTIVEADGSKRQLPGSYDVSNMELSFVDPIAEGVEPPPGWKPGRKIQHISSSGAGGSVIYKFPRIKFNQNKVDVVKDKSPKVGRNEPCPCGSGKKYKKCCGK